MASDETLVEENDCEEDKRIVVPRRAVDMMRYKLDKLMKNPDKPVSIPQRQEGKLPRVFRPPEFVRNIWGSSAGAGSGDFHVYRGVRRREYARQKFNDFKADMDEKNAVYHEKVVENKVKAEERTAKKRAKRLKKKNKTKGKPVKKDVKNEEGVVEEDEDSDADMEEDVIQPIK